MIIIVMGISGCGKSTIGRLLARRLHLPFYDADDYHPEQNIAKMKNGIPLTDEDRQPWLEQLAALTEQWEKNKGAILACSALKEKYRQLLQKNVVAQWVYLEGDPETIHLRCKDRKGHFMPASLIQSQYDTLEKPAYGIHLDIKLSPEDLVEKVIKELNL
ncbi:gluconokinase [Cytophagaceae bacterium ABcell3]|nr:gluconokinase [Cytophagaceae bacterium ABcell3]